MSLVTVSLLREGIPYSAIQEASIGEVTRWYAAIIVKNELEQEAQKAN